MAIYSVSNPDFFKIEIQATSEKFFGCDQEWYSTEWQRQSGCGPTVASSPIRYLIYKKGVTYSVVLIVQT